MSAKKIQQKLLIPSELSLFLSLGLGLKRCRFSSEADMNGEDYRSNAKAAVATVLNTGIGREVNNRCDEESSHSELSTSTSKAIESKRIDPSVIYLSFTNIPHLMTLSRGTNLSPALLNILNDDRMDTW